VTRRSGRPAREDEMQVLTAARNDREEFPALCEESICLFLCRNSCNFQMAGSSHVASSSFVMIPEVNRPQPGRPSGNAHPRLRSDRRRLLVERIGCYSSERRSIEPTSGQRAMPSASRDESPLFGDEIRPDASGQARLFEQHYSSRPAGS
jgi:hypothetical protein